MVVLDDGCTHFLDLWNGALQVEGFGQDDLVNLLDVDGFGCGAKDERRLHGTGVSPCLDWGWFNNRIILVVTLFFPGVTCLVTSS